ncbi:hypothetical protein [uncultured Chitinophaga sp.]|uniref:hypothetical protein n=1 Tax=uncultured Chitinophaga sp. TaxID=339340 RepID=UPI00261F28EE|nr:hypothetical protein [uncultured Chitinophaga sp.]
MKKQPLKRLSLGKIKIAPLSQSMPGMPQGEAVISIPITCSVLCPTRPCTTPPPPDQFR